MKNPLLLLGACAVGVAIAAAAPQNAEAQDVSVDCSRANFSGDYCDFVLPPRFNPDPVTGTGVSGGPEFTNDCGYIDTTPDHIVTVTNGFSYLRAYVDSPGDVTLLVTGPDGRFCRDDVNGLLPVLYGSWPPGTYNIWVGDWNNSNFPYTLYLTEIQ